MPFSARLSARRCLSALIVASLLVSTSGCGTLFYPERKGQLPGRIDPGVAVADGLGLLLFIVPGVIAYAVDFSNNTIYLPGTHQASVDRVEFQGRLESARLAHLIATHSGHQVDLAHELVRVEQLDSVEDARLAIARLNAADSGS
ncbi:hypothetical protein [Salinicola avicenniae]|uniref:hypothetical protein n=1 Tax=Salinicola avicenniae TaxID=2916836 RepID=UPI0020743982|nr:MULTISPECIES: hypothetical protein [unclassified Salinicola]